MTITSTPQRKGSKRTFEGLVASGRRQLEEGRYQHALRSFESAAEMRPERPDAMEFIGRTLIALGRIEEAERRYEVLSRDHPTFLPGLAGRGLLALAQGDLERAEEYLREASDREPGAADAWLGLGEIARIRGARARAEDCYRRARESPAVRAHADAALGRLALAARRWSDACDHFLEGLEADPGHPACRAGLTQLVAERRPLATTTPLLETLRRLVDSGRVDAQRIAPGCLGLIRVVTPIVDLVIAETEGEAVDEPPARRAAQELLLALLRAAVVADSELEESLVSARQKLLVRVSEGNSLGRAFDLAVACAHQCHLNYYVYAADAGEESLAARLAQELAEKLEGGGRPGRELEARLVAISMYRGLEGGQLGRSLSRTPLENWSPPVRDLVRTQVLNRIEESRISACVPPLVDSRPNNGELWEPVRRQYEEYPYPAWRTLDWPRPVSVAALLRSLFPRASIAPSLRRPCSILVAGCGTGKHALSTALRFVHTRVVGLDISGESLAYAERMRSELGIENVDFRRGAIEELEGYEERFDVIECVGVLHHLEDPAEGWRLLVDLLRPGGVMKIGLYSRTARAGVASARQHLTELSLTGRPPDVRHARAAIRALPPSHPGRSFAVFSDFYSVPGTVDLLFHVREHLYDLPQIDELLERLELSMLGFEVLPPGARDAYHALFPDDPAGTNLEFWHAFEQMYPTTFASMYQFWCARRDAGD